jgi:phosphoinositide-3-kinase regulatory subunit 4
MGQGFSLATPSAGSAGIDIPQLQDIQYEKSIGNARFMKSIRGRHEHGVVLVKVLVKPYTDVKLGKEKKKIIGELSCICDERGGHTWRECNHMLIVACLCPLIRAE